MLKIFVYLNPCEVMSSSIVVQCELHVIKRLMEQVDYVGENSEECMSKIQGLFKDL